MTKLCKTLQCECEPTSCQTATYVQHFQHGGMNYTILSDHIQGRVQTIIKTTTLPGTALKDT